MGVIQSSIMVIRGDDRSSDYNLHKQPCGLTDGLLSTRTTKALMKMASEPKKRNPGAFIYRDNARENGNYYNGVI